MVRVTGIRPLVPAHQHVAQTLMRPDQAKPITLYQPRTALKLLPEFSEQVQLAELLGWALFRRSAANSQKHL
jgi:hypothetical protein